MWYALARLKVELALIGVSVWTWFERFFTPQFFDASERAFRWGTLAIAFVIAVIKLIRMFGGKDDDDFAGTR